LGQTRSVRPEKKDKSRAASLALAAWFQRAPVEANARRVGTYIESYAIAVIPAKILAMVKTTVASRAGGFPR
jgi:hypothetical protein